MKKFFFSIFAIILTVVGISSVFASVSSSSTVRLNMSSADVTMNNLTGNIHTGMAKAIEAPSNAMTINWKLYIKKLFGNENVGSGSSAGLNDMAWHTLGQVNYSADGNYIHNFYANGSYYGNVQGSNY